MIEIKWYSPFLFLVGTILSFADPITDILTLVEFYRADHKTWFGVGLMFLILPCLIFSFLHCHYTCKNENCQPEHCLCCGFHPFAPALVKLKAFILCLKYFKQRWQEDDASWYVESEFEDLQPRIGRTAVIETVLESAPQFIIQLYAMSVQEEPMQIIQMVSLPVSFLTLAWALTTADEMINTNEKGTIHTLPVKHKVLLFFTHLFLLSSRLFAITFFTVSFKWWVIGVLIFHSIAIVIIDTILFCVCGGGYFLFLCLACCPSLMSEFMQNFCSPFLFCCLHWLRDDMSKSSLDDDDLREAQIRRMKICNILFVLENLFMILLFYFSRYSDTWYSLPVTVCVCFFSIFGAIVRVIHINFLFNHK